VIRLEDESLGDLGDLVLEVFDSRAPPEGRVLLFGSTFILHEVGVTAYAAAWTSLVEMLKNKWKDVRVCLLIPIIREGGTSSLARELQEVASWMISVYQGSSLGLSESWLSLSAMLTHSTTPIGLLEYEDRYRTSLPAKLSTSAPLVSGTLVSNSARPATLIGFGKVATNLSYCALFNNSLPKRCTCVHSPSFIL
jgi:hypothetical protein